MWKKIGDDMPKEDCLVLVHENGEIRLRYWNARTESFEMLDPEPDAGFSVPEYHLCQNPTEWMLAPKPPQGKL